MTDRELLELAAKAAGIEEGIGGAFWTEFGVFDPLTDDGDALRLAVRLGMSVISGTYKVVCEWIPQEGDDGNITTYEQYGTDPYAATRRAIVRAAAEVGKGMK